MRTPPDHGAGMFRGAFGPVVRLDKSGVRPAKPKNVPGSGTDTVTVNDAVPSNRIYQYG